MAMKLFVENKVMAVRRCAKSDLKSIAKASGGWLRLQHCSFDALFFHDDKFISFSPIHLKM